MSNLLDTEEKTSTARQFRRDLIAAQAGVGRNLSETKKSVRWGERLARLLKRQIIEDELGAGRELEKIKYEARHFETSVLSRRDHKLKTVISELLTKEFLIDGKRAALAGNLQRELQKRFPQLGEFGIIIVGSGVHGGSTIRELTQNYVDTDFDWGIVSTGDNALSYLDREEINAYAKPIIKQLGLNFGLGPDFHGCKAYNCTEVHARPFLSDGECVARIIQDPWISETDPLLLAFYPSFPAKINQRNREIVLQALRLVYKDDPDLWRKVVNQMEKRWREAHILKEKHLMKQSFFGSKRSVQMATAISEDSAQLMMRTFHELLESTKLS